MLLFQDTFIVREHLQLIKSRETMVIKASYRSDCLEKILNKPNNEIHVCSRGFWEMNRIIRFHTVIQRCSLKVHMTVRINQFMPVYVIVRSEKGNKS